MKYHWLLFDADHTLLDFDASELIALEAACNSLSLEYDSSWLDIYKGINRQLWPRLSAGEIDGDQLRTLRFEGFLDAIAAESDGALERPIRSNGGRKVFAHLLSETYLELLRQHPVLVDGAREMLHRLQGDYQMAVLTNGFFDVQRARFANCHSDHYFEHIITSQEAGVAKPHPDIFAFALDRIGFHQKDRILMIGDNFYSDVRGAEDFGISACWYNPSAMAAPDGQSARIEISALSELMSIL